MHSFSRYSDHTESYSPQAIAFIYSWDRKILLRFVNYYLVLFKAINIVSDMNLLRVCQYLRDNSMSVKFLLEDGRRFLLFEACLTVNGALYENA